MNKRVGKRIILLCLINQGGFTDKKEKAGK